MNKSIEKLQKEHELKLELLKLKGKHKKEENKIKNEIKHDFLISEKDNLKVTEEIRTLKINVNQDKKIIFAGNFLNFWGTLGTITSTILTIAGLYSFYCQTYLKSIAFILAIILTQFSVYVLAKQDTNIKRNFKQHVLKASILKFLLLTVSLYGNFTYFSTNRQMSITDIVTTIFICLAIDLISIYCISIAQDFKTLNKNNSTDNFHTGIIKKIIFNKTHKLFSKIETEYQNNKNTPNLIQDKKTNKESVKNNTLNVDDVSNVVQDKTINKDSDKKEVSKIQNISNLVNDSDLELVKNAILDNKESNICPSQKVLMDNTGLTKNKIVAIKKELEKQGIIETVGMTTYVTNKEVII